MNRTSMTKPQLMILEAVENARVPIPVIKIKVASPSYTTRVLRMLREAKPKLVFIAYWERAQGNNNGFFPLYAPGNRPDAIKPVADAEELRRRKQVRQRAQVMKKREADRSAIEPVELPAFTPRLGVWGL